MIFIVHNKKVLAAANGKITFLNTSGRNVKIKTYNENDIIHGVPYQTLTVAPNNVAELQAKGEKFINVYVDGVLFKGIKIVTLFQWCK